jgi:enoyl-CoA hydratase/carnithine racemase
VAAINGPAIGIGLTMALPFDRIVVADAPSSACAS